MSQGAQDYLYTIWKKQGFPFGTFEAWIEALGYQYFREYTQVGD
jgi:guanyl-specific ribonuclease Sa